MKKGLSLVCMMITAVFLLILQFNSDKHIKDTLTTKGIYTTKNAVDSSVFLSHVADQLIYTKCTNLQIDAQINAILYDPKILLTLNRSNRHKFNLFFNSNRFDQNILL